MLELKERSTSAIIRQGFSPSALLMFWNGEFFVVGGCPVHV